MDFAYFKTIKYLKTIKNANVRLQLQLLKTIVEFTNKNNAIHWTTYVKTTQTESQT